MSNRQLVTHVGLYSLVNLRDSLEELVYNRYSIKQSDMQHLQLTAIALIDVFRQCTRLCKVSLLGDALIGVELEELLPYGHLFHELEFGMQFRTSVYERSLGNYLSTCQNLRKLKYIGSGAERDSLVLFTVFRSCPLLEQLDLSLFRRDSFNPQVAIPSRLGCQRLYKLTLWHSVMSTTMLRIITGMEMLKELVLSHCEELSDATMAILATTNLVKLSIDDSNWMTWTWTASALQPFVGSSISQTLEVFSLSFLVRSRIDDVQVAMVFASCHNLTSLSIETDPDNCLFGRGGLAGLQAMATGCPLLTDIALRMSDEGMQYIARHFPNLKRFTTTVEDDDLVDRVRDDLRNLNPVVEWKFVVDEMMYDDGDEYDDFED